MRIGLLFLLLQSVLLCATVQAGPVASDKLLSTAAAAVDGSCGGKDDPLPQDGDVELQRAASVDTARTPTTVAATFAAGNSLPVGRCAANIIRAPPSLA